MLRTLRQRTTRSSIARHIRLNTVSRKTLLIYAAAALALIPGCSSDSSDADNMANNLSGALGGSSGAAGSLNVPAAAGNSGAPMTAATAGAGGTSNTPQANAGAAGTSVVAAGGAAAGATGEAGAGGAADEAVTAVVNPPGNEGEGDHMETGPYELHPDNTVQDDVPKGTVIEYNMAGGGSAFYEGDRACAVYIPNGYVSGTEVPLMVALDGVQFGKAYFNALIPVLDNLIDQGKLPPMAAIFADPGGNRDEEYRPRSGKNAEFFEAEVLPEAVRQAKTEMDIDLNITKDPAGRGVMGGSAGGIGAMNMGWFHPELFPRILSFSGSFGGTEWQNGLIADEPEVKDIRVFLHKGSNDGTDPSEDVAAQLKDKGYHYNFLLSEGAGHTEQNVIRSFLPDAMLWLWMGYPVP